MDRGDVTWRGYWPAAPTPFDDDHAVDAPALADLLGLYVTAGVHGILVNGSSGEWFSQTPQERRHVVEVAVEAVGKRVPVIVGVSAYTADEAADLARHAARVGADGVLATPPPYVHPSPDEVVAFYTTVAGATDLPFMVYNWPRGVTVDLGRTPGLMGRLADIEQVVAIKDSTGDWNGLLSTVAAVADRVRVFGSFVHRPGLAILTGFGGDGSIDGGGVGAPFAVPFYDAVARGDVAEARVWCDRYARLSAGLVNPDYSTRFASPVPQLKAAMALLGQPGGTVRPPLLALTDPAALAAMTAVLHDNGLVESVAATRS